MPRIVITSFLFLVFSVGSVIISRPGKTNVLIQAYISRYSLDAFSLVADTNYISQNIGRICRALFELCLRHGWPSLSDTLLTLAKACERRVWPFQHCLRQFDSVLSAELLHKLENRRATFERLYDMRAEEIGSLLKLNTPIGKKVRNCIDSFPNLDVSAILQPITRTVVRVQVTIEAAFKWKDSIHGASQRWLLWVEDQHNEYIYHSDTVIFTKKQAHESPLVWSWKLRILAITVSSHA
jgi:activating signal cointegrator complex subunit 3